MSYRLKPGGRIDSEVRRIAGRQLQRALIEMRGIGTPDSDRTVHEARRRLKKVRALIRLVQPAMGDGYGEINGHLRAAIRLLAPIADGESVIGTLSELTTTCPNILPQDAAASIRGGLVLRERRVDLKAALDDVLHRATALVRTELERLPRWTLRAEGLHAVAGGLEKTVRDARHAMKRARATPRNDTFLHWRHRVKDHWLQTRLIEGRTGNAFRTVEEQLEALDGILGAHHNCALLVDILEGAPVASRHDTAACLRVLRRRQAKLRADALTIGAQIYRDKPSHVITSIRQQWRLAERLKAREAQASGGRRAA